MIREYHDILPVGNEKHATLYVNDIPELEIIGLCQINGVWNSGWEFPTIYPHDYHPKLDNNNKREGDNAPPT